MRIMGHSVSAELRARPPRRPSIGVGRYGVLSPADRLGARERV